MKLVSFWHADAGQPRLGALVNGAVVDLSVGGFPRDLKTFIQMGPSTWQQAAVWAALPDRAGLDVDSTRLLAPITDPGKIIAIGLNYRSHCIEQNIPLPDKPVIFSKFNSAILSPGESIQWHTSVTRQVDFETELGVIIGQRASHVRADQAQQHVFGYTVLNDVSARDVQFSERQWVRAKSLDTFCPLGPVVVTTAEIPDPQTLPMRTRVNGVTLQDSSSADMIFSVSELVSYCSRSFTLEPGDVIATGTPAGVGVFRKPPIFLQDGDRVECEIDGIGTLANLCRVIND